MSFTFFDLFLDNSDLYILGPSILIDKNKLQTWMCTVHAKAFKKRLGSRVAKKNRTKKTLPALHFSSLANIFWTHTFEFKRSYSMLQLYK